MSLGCKRPENQTDGKLVERAIYQPMLVLIIDFKIIYSLNSKVLNNNLS
jgi:hypothetical protein